MNGDEIIKMWEKDARIDETSLGRSVQDIPNLVTKYYPLLFKARRDRTKLKLVRKKLMAMKREFYNNPTDEDYDRGWVYPSRKILKNELSDFVETDNDVLKLELKLAELDEIVDLLREILKQLRDRNFIVSNMIEDRKFMNGG